MAKEDLAIREDLAIKKVHCGTNILNECEEFAMRKNVLVIAFLIALVAPAAAQKAQIEAVNAKWME